MNSNQHRLLKYFQNAYPHIRWEIYGANAITADLKGNSRFTIWPDDGGYKITEHSKSHGLWIARHMVHVTNMLDLGVQMERIQQSVAAYEEEKK